MSLTPVTIQWANKSYLSVNQQDMVVLTAEPTTVWLLANFQADGPLFTSALQHDFEGLGGDLNLLEAAQSCPVVMRGSSEATLFSVGGVPINGLRPITVNGVSADLVVDSAGNVILSTDQSKDRGWIVTPL